MCVHLKISVLRLIWTLGLKFRFSLWASSLTQHWVKISIIHMGVNTCWCQIVANPLQYNIMTVDGCEILHHQEDGWKPVNNGMFTTYQLVQDFATIHSMAMKLKPEKGPRIDLHVFSIEHLVIGVTQSWPIPHIRIYNKNTNPQKMAKVCQAPKIRRFQPKTSPVDTAGGWQDIGLLADGCGDVYRHETLGERTLW